MAGSLPEPALFKEIVYLKETKTESKQLDP